MAKTIGVIIPAFNEAQSIGLVLEAIPGDLIQTVVVCDNGSTDDTAKIAMSAGAVVVHEPERGYGKACLAGITYLNQTDTPPDIVAFLDGDFSDFPEELPVVVEPILKGQADLVIGSRVLGKREQGALLLHQQFGNWLAVTLIRTLYGYTFSDLGPFRAIRRQDLVRLGMKDKNYGWTVEMQVKAAKYKLRCTEVPVNYRKRVGKSKVSGTVKGSLLAGYKIIFTIFKEKMTPLRQFVG